jgi:glycosyltransferase involved in cell wall biosynthesis
MAKRNEKRILQITACPFPPEIRVVKEGISLQIAGYQSAVLCPPSKGRPERETWREIQIFRPTSLSASEKTIDKFLYQTTFFSPSWFYAIKQVIAEYHPDVIHVHDIWLGRTVFWAESGQKIVMDLHENMPAAVVEYVKGYRGLFKWFTAVFKNPNRVLRYERSLLNKSDKVFVVVEEALERVLETHAHLGKEKVINIENLESKEFLNGLHESEQVIEKDLFSVLYIGGFGPHRGIDTLIRSMQHIKKWGLKVRLYLVGARGNSGYLRILKDLIRSLDVASHITIIEWVPSESVLAYIRQASVGAVPHHSNPHTNSTVPHKLYQYMIASTPVLVSSSPPLARAVRTANSGVVFEAGNDLDCAKKIRRMFDNPTELEKYGVNGFNYVIRDGHNWEEESAPSLVASYDSLLNIAT